MFKLLNFHSQSSSSRRYWVGKKIRNLHIFVIKYIITSWYFRAGMYKFHSSLPAENSQSSYKHYSHAHICGCCCQYKQTTLLLQENWFQIIQINLYTVIFRIKYYFLKLFIKYLHCLNHVKLFRILIQGRIFKHGRTIDIFWISKSPDEPRLFLEKYFRIILVALLLSFYI